MREVIENIAGYGYGSAEVAASPVSLQDLELLEITVGFTPDELNQIFASCQLAAQLSNPYGVVNDIYRDRDRVYICRNIRSSWPEFWKHFQSYG